VTVIVPESEVAIGGGAADIGRARLRNVRDGLTVASADVRGQEERPHGFGVGHPPSTWPAEELA
jgi:hypothetical protein